MGLQFRAVGSSDFDLNEEKMKFPRQVEVVALKQRYYASGDAKVMFDYYSAYDYFEVYKSKNSEEEKSTRSKSDNKKKSSESQKDNNKKNASRTTFTPNQSTWFNECSSIAKLKQTYKKLSKIYHPDNNSETGSENTIKEISEEYQKLKKYFEDIKGKTNE